MNYSIKVPTFKEAIIAKDIFNYEIHRNVLGWQLSYCGEEISVLINKDQAEQIIEKMENQDRAFDEQICLDEENV